MPNDKLGRLESEPLIGEQGRGFGWLKRGQITKKNETG